jgi:hypothetical protein
MSAEEQLEWKNEAYHGMVQDGTVKNGECPIGWGREKT